MVTSNDNRAGFGQRHTAVFKPMKMTAKQTVQTIQQIQGIVPPIHRIGATTRCHEPGNQYDGEQKYRDRYDPEHNKPFIVDVSCA